MSGYTQKVRNSILPLSVAETLPATFAEWSVTDNTVDHKQSVEIITVADALTSGYSVETAVIDDAYATWWRCGHRRRSAAISRYRGQSAVFGGRGGIRTHGRLAPTAVFKTAALNHSATLPNL